MYSNGNIKFEFFKGFTIHFLPLSGDEITIEEATQLSKCGGGCGGPYWPVRQSANNESLKFEAESKRLAERFHSEFDVVNELPPNSPWWKKNTLYLKWLGFKADRKQHRYGVKRKPALVVKFKNKSKAFYTWKGLENKIQKFISKAMLDSYN
ncbi:hypothetical protein [[Eubacterium] cellulosolvens]